MASIPSIARLDQRYVWHPFTQMRDWLRQEPRVVVEGRGAVLRDARGREYLDANASIWTNLHGHRHPALDRAVRAQLKRIAHCSALGLANEPASRLAAKLVLAARAAGPRAAGPRAAKVFYSDDGSTAVETALKLAHQYALRSGLSSRPAFLSLAGAYHGDTVGATSLGHIDLFHKAYSGLLFKTDRAPAPYCYRCRFNRAAPERADARDYRQCQWECLAPIERLCQTRKEPYAGFVFEPLIQGAAGMIAQPDTWLRRAAEMIRSRGTLLIADEVLTGFGRVGTRSPSLFASHAERVRPDLMALAKGLSGGYLPMAATLASQAIFDQFLGDYEEFKTFFHGHSYTGNPLGAAVSIASLDLLASEESRRSRLRLEQGMKQGLAALWSCERVGDIRQVGLIAGIELVRDWRTREPFPLRERVGARVCEVMAQNGVLTRPIGNVLVLMPPYCTTPAQLRRMISAIQEALETVFPRRR